MQLAENIMYRIEIICKNLWSAKVISKHMVEDIMEGKNTDRKRAMALLDLLPSRGPYAFDLFFKSLVDNELFEAAYILKPEQRTIHANLSISFVAQPSERLQQHNVLGNVEQIDEELPDVWPSAEALESIEVRKITKNDTAIKKIYEYSLQPKGQTEYYTMKSTKKGKVLVINNEKFEELASRNGSSKDRSSIDKVFQSMNFDVIVKNNLTSQKMKELLDNESKVDFSGIDCYVLIVLSHGHDGVIFGTDGRTDEETNKSINCVEIKYVRDKICSNISLIGKPKIFFIQACQGKNKDFGLYVSPADRQLVGSSARNETSDNQDGDIDLSKYDTKVDDLREEHLETQNQDAIVDQSQIIEDVVPVEATDAVGPKLPSQADIFVALATTAGYLSWRNTALGTWFIQAITYIFAKYAYKYDLNKLMTMVNRLVAKAETIDGKFKQVAEKRDTFTKTFYFFPGLPDN
ncbi:Cell death protein 3 [Bulinus truncatus]|nr:Cell death protein 3 [Bulinus truncatus]